MCTWNNETKRILLPSPIKDYTGEFLPKIQERTQHTHSCKAKHHFSVQYYTASTAKTPKLKTTQENYRSISQGYWTKTP